LQVRRRGGGTIADQFRFTDMRIREENCNMVLLAAVACVSVAVAGGANLLGSGAPGPDLNRIAGRVEPMSSPGKPVVYAGDQPAVRMIGAPFVPNTNPRER